jgi:hypothetical protein
MRGCVPALAVAIVACAGTPTSVSDAPDDGAADAAIDVQDAQSERPPFRCERSFADAGSDDAALRCNGSAALCDRRFNEVAFATAHNAMSNADDRWLYPNQEHGIARALADGVRGLMLDTHYDRGSTGLCHGVCTFGRRPLVEGLCDVTQFLDAHPGEVVAIQFENHIADGDTVAAVMASGLGDYVHAQTPGQPWPTLGEMVRGRERLVVFVESGGGSPSWLMPLFAHSWDTPYSFLTAADFSCATNRGTRGNALFTLNHFLTNPTADRALAEMVNHNPVLIDRARRCAIEGGQLPNFVAVDFYSVGDVFAVVAALNGL